MCKNGNVLGQPVKKAEHQPEDNLEKQQANEKYQQNLTQIALDIIQKFEN